MLLSDKIIFSTKFQDDYVLPKSRGRGVITKIHPV